MDDDPTNRPRPQDRPRASGGEREVHFGFRPWVRRTTGRAIVWGLGAVALLGVVTWLVRTPQSVPLSRAFGTLSIYGLLFLATLAKIWWTAGGAAVTLDDDALGYQPLHTFRPKRVPFEGIVACSPKAGTHAFRVVHRRGDRARELFLNLGVVEGRSRFLAELGLRLAADGLEPDGERLHSWRRPGIEIEDAAGAA